MYQSLYYYNPISYGRWELEKYFVNNKYRSKVITSIYIPENIDFNDMHDYLYEKGFTVYPGKVEDFNTFRVANIGDIDFKDISEFLILLEDYMK